MIGYRDSFRVRGLCRRAMRPAGAFVVLLAVARCAAPPTDIIDVSLLPPASQDAMAHVQILPLGTPAPSGLGSVGPVMAYGCGDTPTAAANSAVLQLQAKALQRQATAVMSVLFATAAPTWCHTPHAVTASGIALAQRGIPASW